MVTFTCHYQRTKPCQMKPYQVPPHTCTVPRAIVYTITRSVRGCNNGENFQPVSYRGCVGVQQWRKQKKAENETWLFHPPGPPSLCGESIRNYLLEIAILNAQSTRYGGRSGPKLAPSTDGPPACPQSRSRERRTAAERKCADVRTKTHLYIVVLGMIRSSSNMQRRTYL